MAKIALSIGATLVITYVVTFLVYGMASTLIALQPPTGASATEFLLAVLVMKLGLALGFVLLFARARGAWAQRWRLYALVWWGMLAITELGQAIGPNYSWQEAGVGILAEAIYCPLSAWVTARMLAGAAPATASV